MKNRLILSLICAGFTFSNWVNAHVINNDKPYNEFSWLTAHNSHASKGYVSPPYQNQYFDMYTQMEDYNARGLMIDIRYEDGRVELTHQDDNAGEFVERINNEVVRFLNENPNAVIFIDVEVTDGALTHSQMAETMAQIPNFTNMMFNPEDWKYLKGRWPTLSELIAANQRVFFIVDKKEISGEYNDFEILWRRDITVENMWAVVDKHSCDERHGYGLRYVDDPRLDSWPRLFTMNHFREFGWFGWFTPNDNSWDGLYPRVVDTCIPATGLNIKPNFVALDFISDGDGKQIVDVLNHGGIVFYEGNNAEQNIVCGIGAGIHQDFSAGNNGCENDEARSAKLVNVKKGTSFAVFDSPDRNLSDDFTIITVNEDIGEPGVVINSFEETYSNNKVSVDYFRYNGLDGKVSRFEVKPDGDIDIHNGLLAFYEGNNGSQDLVCSIPISGNKNIDFTSDSYGCDNDEARSMVLHQVRSGTQITVFDSPSANRNDDYTVINVLNDISSYTIDTFEHTFQNPWISVSFRHVNGLDGKVSRVEIRTD
ncbi:hypothetical protein [Vibrio parahaemolyticus]|uniref:hypothetical protein n=1 Tax=Vibrio parahaemolyticus TaxID=670 RepID=UPI000692131C|nr:hypothetical protein [Vibrio parahaemolyticus]ELU8564822.1 hypothetical protein [Vibrio parahaemolyticus]MDS1792028.1 hypothetical protein [Vibrio parahaemolyticus]OTV93206.1 hypothetical protein BA739_24710 [Vibrio parahaemolyticus]OTV98555.1 hypothetical protein BA740_24685 [Vibrio parahaemolyticus]